MQEIPSETEQTRRGAPPVVVVVLGMGRSGTSLLTSILGTLGVRLSDDLIEGNQDNEKGYFESEQVVAVHDRLLETLGAGWDMSSVHHPFPKEWWKLEALRPFKVELANIVNRETSVNGVWGFKDPRAARLLPLWNDLFDESRVDARFVLAIRHPHDVVKSMLRSKDMDSVLAEQLWLEHNVDVILHSNDRLRAIVDYDRWFSEPIEQATYVAAALGLESAARPELQLALRSRIAHDLRHHDEVTKRCVLPYSQRLYDALAARDEREIKAAAAAFDEARRYASIVIAQEKRRKTINTTLETLRWVRRAVL